MGGRKLMETVFRRGCVHLSFLLQASEDGPPGIWAGSAWGHRELSVSTKAVHGMVKIVAFPGAVRNQAVNVTRKPSCGLAAMSHVPRTSNGQVLPGKDTGWRRTSAFGIAQTLPWL